MTRMAGVIPARFGSTRFPGKMLAPVAGRPLLDWVIDRALEVSLFDEVLVATDDARIADAVGHRPVEVIMTKSTHPSGTDRIAEAMEGRSADIVVNLQGDEPLMDPLLVESVARVLIDEEAWDMGTAATPLNTLEQLENPSAVKVVCDAAGGALYFSRLPIPFIREAGDSTRATGFHMRHLGLYAYRASFLKKLVQTPPCMLEELEKLEQLRALYIGGRIRVVETEHAPLGVDTPADVAAAEAELRARGLAPPLDPGGES